MSRQLICGGQVAQIGECNFLNDGNPPLALITLNDRDRALDLRGPGIEALSEVARWLH